jgi:hypothetical protein
MSAGKKRVRKAPVDKGKDNCGAIEGRWFNYERIGLYWVTRRRRERINFCDLHFYGSLGDLGNQRTDEPEGHNGSYSGPDQSLVPSRNYWRTKEERDMYGRCVEARGDDDSLPPCYWSYMPRGPEFGGGAKMIFNFKRGAFECWLFGPLHLSGPDEQQVGIRAYGSLIAELDGFDLHPWKQSRRSWPKGGIKSPTDDTPWDAPGKGRVGVFRPCTLWGTLYVTDKRDSKGTDHSKLAAMMWTDEIFPVHLPKSIDSVEWKIESAVTKLTLCQVYEQHG